MQERSTVWKHCLLRKYKVVEIDTDFTLEYVIPIHGSILVAFKDAVSLPWQDGTHTVGAIPVDVLLNVAKVGFASYGSALSRFLGL